MDDFYEVTPVMMGCKQIELVRRKIFSAALSIGMSPDCIFQQFVENRGCIFETLDEASVYITYPKEIS